MVPSTYYETFCRFMKLSEDRYMMYETFCRVTKLSEDWYMMYETTNHSTKLTKSFVPKLRNPVKSAELKKVLN